MKNQEFKAKKLGNDTVYTLTEMTAGATGSGSVATAVKGVGKLQRRSDSIIMQDKESKDKPTPPTVRNPVAHAAQRVAKGSGSHDDKKFNRKEKHKKPHFEDDSMEESYWNHTGFGNRPGSGGSSFRDRERNAGLENEINNIGIMINGRKWKIFPGRGPEGSQEWFNQRQKMKDMCARKTAETGKQWTMYITGERPTNETVAENDMMSFFKDLQKNDPKYKNLRIHGDPEHDELRKQDELDRQKRRESDAERNKQAMAAQVERDRAMLPDLKAQLAELEKTFDPHYEYSDDYTLWSKQKAIASNIQRLRDRIAKAEGSVSEGNHPDEKEDKALIRKMVKPKALKKEDHSTATSGWGQGARPAIDVSSKLIGQGRDDAIHENPDWYSDEANSMSTAQLKSLVKHAAKLRHAVKQMQAQGDTLEPWQQAKVTKASDYLDTVFNAVDDDHDMGEDKSVLNIDNEPEMASALRKGQTVGMAESDEYISELYSKLSEKIAKNAPVKTYIDDFEKAAKTPNAKGHHQFKNKSKEKVRQMAIAASYDAKTPSKKKK